MTQEQKDDYLKQAQEVLADKRQAIKNSTDAIPAEVLKLKELQNGSAADKLSYATMTAMYRKRYDDLQNLYPSPYFYSCLIKFAGEQDFRELYFAKFAFDQESIYSWASPIARLRFEDVGEFALIGEQAKQVGEMMKKDQYLINDGKILFLATEKDGQGRELIYQEYFSTRKTSFVLPEIVAQMEKAQDQVIRADYGGKLIVTGPAGSGKTTLALHRAAYLLQSPETSDKLSAKDIIVFVQDESTKDYFSHLLPDLGIRDVEITTLASWVKNVLSLKNLTIADQEKDADAEYIWHKIQAIRTAVKAKWQTNLFDILSDVYESLDDGLKKKLADQKKKKIIDRIDLAALLKIFLNANSELMIEKDYYSMIGKTKELKIKRGKFRAEYKLMIIDEFQNYLPEQLDVFKRALNSSVGEMVFIGDFNQRVRLGTISDAAMLGEISSERIVELSKIYRNTKEILNYLNSIGYKVAVPKEIKTGPEVAEKALNAEAQIDYVMKHIQDLAGVSVGVLSHNERLLDLARQRLGDYDKVKIMPLIDSQGVEFDTVFLIGVDDGLLSADDLPEEVRSEVLKIKKDLLYIALTRAMNGLHVLGEKRLSEIRK